MFSLHVTSASYSEMGAMSVRQEKSLACHSVFLSLMEQA